MISEIGILIRSAAKPPINPPNTQEFNVFAKIRTTADAIISTNASAATLMNTVPFLLCPTMMRFWNTLIYFTTNLSVEYSRLSGFLQEDFEAREVKDTLPHKCTGEEKKIVSSSPVRGVLRPDSAKSFGISLKACCRQVTRHYTFGR